MKRFLMLCCFATVQAYDVNFLSLDEKIGQLLMVAAVSNPDRNEAMQQFIKNSSYRMHPEYIRSLIESHHIGGVIFLGKAFDPGHAKGTAHDQYPLTRELQHASKKIPLMIGLDAEWGLGMRLEDDVISFPQAMALGALRADDEHLIYKMAYEIGMQCKAIGVHINFAPVADVNTNPHNPVIGSRSFGDDPHAVARKAALYAKGLHDAGILACAKHFPGHGDTNVDSHYGLPRSDHTMQRLHEIELAPFKYLIDHDIASVMTAHMIVPSLDSEMATVSYPILTDLLRTQLGFKGLIITDGLGMHAVTKHYSSGEVAVRALKAGVDILLCPVDVSATIAAIKNAVHEGVLTESELDEKVSRILQEKKRVCHDVHEDERCVFDFIVRNDAQKLMQEIYQSAVTRMNGNTTIARNDHPTILISEHMKQSVFMKAMQNHCLCDIYTYESITDADIAAMNKTQHVIIVMQLPVRFVPNDTSYQKICEKVRLIASNKIIVLFGSPYYIPYLNIEGQWIIGYEDADDAQRACARVLSGQIEARGSLPIRLMPCLQDVDNNSRDCPL